MENTKECYLLRHRCFGHCEKHCYTENGYLIWDHDFLCVEQNIMEDDIKGLSNDR